MTLPYRDCALLSLPIPIYRAVKVGGEGVFVMLEHPEIGWIERTGYPSWMQEGRPGCAWVDFEEEEEWQDRSHNGN